MARIVICFFILLFSFAVQPAKADVQLSTQSLITPQNIPYEYCTSIFNIKNENLFYLTLASINANKFVIDEIQTKSGYILFTAAGKQFLATVSSLDDKRSTLKVTPANNIYFFPLGIVVNLFKYIELNAELKPVELKKI